MITLKRRLPLSELRCTGQDCTLRDTCLRHLDSGQPHYPTLAFMLHPPVAYDDGEAFCDEYEVNDLREVEATAPPIIHLNVSDEKCDWHEPFVKIEDQSEVTWSPEPALTVAIEYIRADIHAAEVERLDQEVKTLTAERERLNKALEQAVAYLKEGKAKFAPSTTNSLVDDFIAKWENR